MNNGIADLLTAINLRDRTAAENLINDLTAKQVDDFLRSKENGKTIDHVFTASSLDVAFILLKKSQNKAINTNTQVNWFEIFDLLEDFMMAFTRKYRKIPAKAFASKISFLARWKQEIDTRSLIKRPKFFATALLLGAKFVPQFQGETIFSFVFKSGDFVTGKQRKVLIEWLLDHKFITEQDVSVKIFAEIIQSGRRLAELLFKHFPSLLDVKDPSGCNVMHYCLPKLVRVKLFTQGFNFVSSHATPEQLQAMLIAKNASGSIPVIVICKEALTIPTFLFPPSILAAVIRLAKEKQNLFEELFNGILWRNTLIKAYLLQSGMKIPLNYFTERKDITNFSQLFWFAKPPKQHVNKKPSVSTNQSEAHNEISVLPNEILFLIAADLKPVELVPFSMTCKTMMEFFHVRENEMFWKEYYLRNFRSEGSNWQGPSYKSKFIQETRGQSNWRNNKKTTIVLDGYQPLMIDENWLLMKSNDNHAAYWNCHTQHVFRDEKKELGSYSPLAILQNYSSGSLPPIMYASSSRNYPGPRVVIRAGDEETAPKKLIEKLADVNLIQCAIPIDHRVLVTHSGLLYNAEIDEFIGQGTVESRATRCCLNPFNRTFLIRDTNATRIYNYQYELQTAFPTMSPYDANVWQVVDEHTLFFQEFCSNLSAGYLDLRTGKKIWEQVFMLPLCYNKVDFATSSTRLVIRDGHTDLLGSYHLPSQKFEWIHQNEFPGTNYWSSMTPTAVNNRYLVSSFKHKASTVLYDFCSDA